ncbi:ABC transporter ATP-binding protein [Erythrobacter sp. SCSIO 43205]|uniref:ABC transporter ATP-binding protein n=1 Tax=Erythrobacter sp. SCSIO 43205 TaxID=2779361 RepID=UPI001CA9C43E|nr:ABC transporter ATP-binding protein [Erythrobacter sp. SCSIO 43205]UAB77832.1 ABC transporter ATP-binding protein [Erythrobacter sp. SCSIO 43205]
MTSLKAENLSFSAKGTPLVHDASFALEAGTLTALVGPNGAGKTTLLRLSLGLLPSDKGHVEIDGHDIATLSPMERSRKVAYLPQIRPLAWPQPVRDLVALGRFAYGASPDKLSEADEAAVANAITACQLDGFETRSADTLSGGELSRAHLARALAAETPVLIADEPVAALDPRHSHEVLSLFKRAADRGQAVLCVIHDLSLAARYCDRLIWMKEGRIVADGSPVDTLTAERLRDVFGITALSHVNAQGEITLDIQGPA